MNAIAKQKMTVDECLSWSEGREGRHELVEGEVFAMSPQRVSHAIAKMNAVNASRRHREGFPTRTAAEGEIRLDPPGLTVSLTDALAAG